ncbi:hypothetical protein CRENBAI_020230 [Crenichthys baileyi]|uniref:Lipoxygenase domain-containing protein n=1 Tax=Crenichthys baileyi TaxID=28760 RepID=A0AAV9S4B2_9TELE
MVEYYYPSDSNVLKDTELQEWINEIFIHGFLKNEHAVDEVAKFVTMLIFRVSVQHAAVNNGQYDYSSWMPNGSLQLCKPPPTTKGPSSMQTVLEVLLGEFPEEHFVEAVPKQILKAFQADLSYLREEIAARNSQLKIPYPYLNPALTENSVAI